MKTILQAVLFSLFICCSANAQVSDFHFNTGGIQDITVKNGIVAVLGSYGYVDSINGKYAYKSFSSVGIKKDGNWQNLPKTIIRNNVFDSIQFSFPNKIQIDSKNNIWITGKKGIYRFDGNQWNEFYIDDEYKDDRIYQLLLVDKRDNVYLTSFVDKRPIEPIKFSELIKFENGEFIVIQKQFNPELYSPLSRFQKSNNFLELLDSSVILGHRLNEEFDITKIDKNRSISNYKIDTYPYVSTELSLSKVIQHSDGTIWFASIEGGEIINGEYHAMCCWGVYYTNNLLEYFSLSKMNGYPIGNFPNPCVGIAEIPNGNLLIATSDTVIKFHVLNNSNQLMKSIDNKEFFKNAIVVPPNANPYFENYYKNLVDSLQQGLIFDQKNNSYFQSINFDTEGTIYLNFSGFLLEIPASNITSVDAGVEVTDALRVFPNPAENSIRIDGTKEIRSVTATNILGSEVLLSSKGNNTFGISNLSTGMYTLVIQHIDNSISRTMFIKK